MLIGSSAGLDMLRVRKRSEMARGFIGELFFNFNIFLQCIIKKKIILNNNVFHFSFHVQGKTVT